VSVTEFDLVRETPVPPELREWGLEMGVRTMRRFETLRSPGYSVLLTRDPLGPEGIDPRWHLSVAGQTHLPPWDVVVAIAHDVRPGVPFVIGVPPRSWWINVHPHCLHLWECRDLNLIDCWRDERMGMVPS
jgi:hypothetical protein